MLEVEATSHKKVAASDKKKASHIEIASDNFDGISAQGSGLQTPGLTNGVFNPLGLQSNAFPVLIPAIVPPSQSGTGGSGGPIGRFTPEAGMAGGGYSGGSAGGSTATPVITGTSSTAASSPSASPFVINITWDSSVSSAPSGFKTAVLNAAQYLESHFTDAVTVNINVGYGEVAGSSLGSGALGESNSYFSSVSYSSLLNAMQNDATSSADASAVASLPSTSPVNGTFWTTTAEAKALGLLSATNPQTDGSVGF